MSVREGYKQTEIGVIPEEWEVAKIGDYCDILDNLRVPISSEKRADIQGEVPYYGANGVQDYINDFIFNETLVLLAEDGGNFSEYQTRPIAYMIHGKSWVNNHTHVLRAKNGENYFLFYSLVHKDITSFINGGTRAKLNRGELVKIPIALPPLLEQQKIAEILSIVDQKINSIDSKIEETQTLKRGLMQRLLSEGIGHSEFKESEIGQIPTGWEVVTLKEVIKELTGGVSVNSEDRIKHENEFGILKTSAIQNGSFYSMAHKTILETEIERATTNPLADHIIFSRMNTPDLVGESGYVDKDYSDLFLPDRLWQINVKDRNIIHVKWLSYVLVSIEVKKKIKSAATGTSNSMKNISKPSLLKISFALPPLEEQKQIAKILSTTDEKLESLRAKKEAFETLKKGLMQKLLSGEVRV